MMQVLWRQVQALLRSLRARRSRQVT